MSSTHDLYMVADEPIMLIRHRHVVICDKNYCAAAMLDIFNAQIVRAMEYSDIRYGKDESDYRFYENSLTGLAAEFFGLFTKEQIYEALLLLVEKKFVTAWQIGEIGIEGDMRLKVLCHQDEVMKACEPLYASRRAQREKEMQERIERERANIANLPPPPTPEELAAGELARIQARELSRVDQHLKRARKANLPATLTLEQWLATLDYFDWKCAYCQANDYYLLEHFVPISMDGGTTQGNCVPACHGCNGVKKSWHPYQIPFSKTKQAKKYTQGLRRVHEYLVSCGCEEALPNE